MKLGIALGGGGIAGCAHIGVLQAMEEAGINIHCLSGTSAGALISALYAYGYSAKELMDEVPFLSKKYLDYDIASLFAKLLGRGNRIPGLIKGKRLHQFISEKTQEAIMGSLTLPVAIMAVDLHTARKVVFSSRAPTVKGIDEEWITDIHVADAVRSSCSIPFLFHPVKYGDRYFVDGGVLDNCPVSALKALGADKTIAVDLVAAEPSQAPFQSCLDVLSRVVSIHLAYQSRELTNEADFVFRPEARYVGAFELRKSIDCIEYGYECTQKKIKEIKNALGN